MFPRVDYLHWMAGRPAAADHDLGTTNQRLGDPLDRLGHRPDPPDDVTLGSLVADALGVEPARLLVTAGTSHANFLATAAALDGGGDEVLVESPGYAPLVALPSGFGASVRRFERPAAAGFALDPERVVAKLTEATALVAVTDRHNPSGRPADPATLDAMAAAAAEHGARLLVDEVYRPFGRASASERQFGAGTAAGREDTVVTGGLTKFLGLGDLRIGWLVADEPFVERAREVAAHVPTVSATNERLAARLLAAPAASVATARAHAATNATLLGTFLAGRDDLRATHHAPCPFAFAAHESADGDAIADAAWDAGVLVIPGRFFDAPARFRLAAGGAPAETERALAAFGAVLDGR